MKGVLLAGGSGTRLLPLTKVTNKHLLPVYNKPMIYYPLNTLKSMGIEEVLIVSGRDHCGHILQLLGSGKEFGMSISYEIQEEAGGIAQALSLAEGFAKGDNIAVILGDNIFEDKFDISDFQLRSKQEGARLFLKETTNPERFGVAQIVKDEIICVVEKPKTYVSNLAVTGLYIYDQSVFHFIKELRPSKRGELEITDVNNRYIQQGTVSFRMVHGEWTDAGTFESLHRANILAKNISEQSNEFVS